MIYVRVIRSYKKWELKLPLVEEWGGGGRGAVAPLGTWGEGPTYTLAPLEFWPDFDKN